MDEITIKKQVREGYAKVAKGQKANSCGSSCCGSNVELSKTISKNVGYSDLEMASVPDGANLGLGCGNPVALASLKEGEVVLDLGSGAGFDCFLASDRVGKTGRVIGVDMTPDMLDKARGNAVKGGYKNVEFRLGEIENLPAADSSVDAVISNCVINLSTNKQRVFNEAFRVLKPGGRVMVSDIVILQELPDVIKNSISGYVGCLSGAMVKKDYLAVIWKAGFTQVTVVKEDVFAIQDMLNDPTVEPIMKELKITKDKAMELASSVLSVKVSAVKPPGSPSL